MMVAVVVFSRLSPSAEEGYNLGQNKWNIWTTPPPYFNMYGLLTKREVKMAGCIARVEVHKHANKELGQCPAILTEQAWSIKDLLYCWFSPIM